MGRNFKIFPVRNLGFLSGRFMFPWTFCNKHEARSSLGVSLGNVVHSVAQLKWFAWHTGKRNSWAIGLCFLAGYTMIHAGSKRWIVAMFVETWSQIWRAFFWSCTHTALIAKCSQVFWNCMVSHAVPAATPPKVERQILPHSASWSNYVRNLCWLISTRLTHASHAWAS